MRRFGIAAASTSSLPSALGKTRAAVKATVPHSLRNRTATAFIQLEAAHIFPMDSTIPGFHSGHEWNAVCSDRPRAHEQVRDIHADLPRAEDPPPRGHRLGL